MDADGSNRVSFDSAFETDPAWSPDGKTIINGCSTSFCVRDADGGDQGFAASFGFVGDTDWQPVGAFAPYPRPATATPTRLALVPAFTQCTNPDSAHVAPLSLPACSAPSQVSNLLTTSSIGRGFGYVLLRAALGDFSTPADEADLLIRTSATDVRNTSDGSDYTGQLLLSLEGTRITDRSSGFGGVSATASDFTFSAPVDCAATAGAAGSACFLNTTADALLPGTVKENKNTVLRIGNAHFSDAGADGMSGGSSCPPTCGTGDEKVYLEQGVFTP
jgi:hypothetical protein